MGPTRPQGAGGQQPRVGAPRIERLRDLAGARDAWCALAPATDNIFSTWEWAETWWRHFGAGRTLELMLLRDQRARPFALLPIYEERRAGVRVRRMIGGGVADELGPVCAPSSLAFATEALVRAGGDALVAERFAGERDWGGLRGSLLTEEPCPVLELAREGSWEQYLRARSANFRQQVRRRERRLTRGHDVRFRLANDPRRLGAELDLLMSLHAARWGGRSLAFAGARREFHREFAALALERGWLRLWLAEAGGSVVAAWLGFRFGEVEYFYQSGRDPRWGRMSVGAGLLEHSIREAFMDGMREYRLLRGAESYKYRYATRNRHVVTIASAVRTRGAPFVVGVRLLALAAACRRRLRAPA